MPKGQKGSGKDIVKFVLRVPPDLHKLTKEAAKTNNTSMNRFIETIMAEALTGRTQQQEIDKIKRDVAKILKIVEGYDFSSS